MHGTEWQGTQPELAQQLSAELERLPGVLAAAVWFGAEGEIEQVRLHTQPQASPSIIAHAATRVLEQRGRVVEPGVLRVLPVVELGDARTAGSSARFLVMHDVVMTRAGNRVSCRVRLARLAEIITGEASELDTEAGRARAAALATLRAAEGTVEELAFGLEGVASTSLFGRRYLAVSVEAAVGRRFAQLTGVVSLDGTRTPEEAACLATLRAIERWIGG